MRKTVSIDQLRDQINHTLLHSEDDYRQGREALGILLERVLLNHNRYRGFRYLSPSDMLKSSGGTTYGINPAPQGQEAGWNQFENSDPTRVQYG